MATTIHIGSVENLYIGGASSVEEEVLRGVDSEVLKDIGYSDVPTEIEQPPVLAEEDQAEVYTSIAERITQEEIDASSRKMFLEELVFYFDRANQDRGFLVNTQGRTPNNPKAVIKNHAVHETVAKGMLEQACGSCALRAQCGIYKRGNSKLDTWVDIHPYKKSGNNQPNRRHGSLRVKQTETRTKFLEALRDDPMAHCDPTKRAK